ncbi:MAG TPA: TraK family protein [Saprospiraceae bacterium]|nr:TraK family protein [Saprospiraceae bacterium]
MTKTLSERIALFADKNKNTGKQFLPAFVALKPDIEQALQDGWTVRQIWNTLHDEKKIKCSYQWFRTLVNRHIADDRKQNTLTTPGKSAITDQEGFRFNSATEKEELI